MSGSIVQLTGLDDFISPSQACIKPAKKVPSKPVSGRPSRIEIEPDGGYYEVGANGMKVELQKASITLNDCLACSGCVTSAESVLVEMQTYKELEQVIQNNQKYAQGIIPGDGAEAVDSGVSEVSKGGDEEDQDTKKKKGPKLVVVSVSPQSVAALSVKYGMKSTVMARKMVGFLKAFGVDKVHDIAMARGFSLLESQAEFLRIFSHTEDPHDKAVSLPMLASACPGWICYAEKTHGDFILPYISSTKSPQQIMGTLVKHFSSNDPDFQKKLPDDIYHVTVMPCLDKKLEASRDDFYSDIYRTRDVDCVITTSEFDVMAISHNVDWATEPEVGFDSPVPGYTAEPILHRGGGSGGYLEHIFRHTVDALYGDKDPKIKYESGRNPDLREVKYVVDGEVKLRFAAAYGFKSIQTIVRQMKRKKCHFDYIEVMACPKGCNNGGGQPKAPGDANDHFEQVEASYNQRDIEEPADNAAVQDL